MLFFLLFFLTLIKSHQSVLVKEDLLDSNSSVPFLVFIYYTRKDFFCPLCEQYKEEIKSLDFPVKTLNFAENVELGSRFLQHTFPAFAVRFGGKTYILDPKDPAELRDVLINMKWKEYMPVKSLIDVNSCFAIVFSKLNRIIFYGIDLFYFLMNYVPDYIVSVFILFIISYLIYSIIDVLKTTSVEKKSKLKCE